MTLLELGFQSVSLHSMMTQKERMATLARFRSDNVKILVATDVASRGLDIPTVQLVVNHNVPSNPKEYVHRVGRTARAGRGGLALTLITPHDIKLLHAIEGRVGKQLEEFKVKGTLFGITQLPNVVLILFVMLPEKEVLKILTQVSVTKREQEIKLDEGDFEEKRRINQRKKLIEEGMDPEEADRHIEAQLEWKRKRKEGGAGSSKKKKKKMVKASENPSTSVNHDADDSD